MKKTILLTAAILLLGAASYAQRSIDMKLVNQVLSKQHPQMFRNDWAPVKVCYTVVDGQILMDYRDTFTYDEDMMLQTEKLTEMKDLGQWYNYEYETTEYGFDDLPAEVLTMVWEDGDWENGMRQTMSYENYGGWVPVLKENLVETWSNGNWVNENKYIYDYDPVITVIIKDWLGNVWTNHYLYTFEYDQYGTGETVLLQYWQGGAWQNQELMTYTFNSSLGMENVLIQEWVNGAWQNYEKHEYAYNGEEVSTITKTRWENGAWSNGFDIHYEYENGNTTHAYSEPNMNCATEIEIFFNEGESITYENVWEITADYADLTQVTENANTSLYSIYPNPADNMIQIQAEGFQKAEIYNIEGQKVMESESELIQVSNLAAGVYMVKIYGSNLESHRLVVK